MAVEKTLSERLSDLLNDIEDQFDIRLKGDLDADASVILTKMEELEQWISLLPS